MRGRNKRKAKWGGFRAQRHGASTALLKRVKDTVKELAQTGAIRDPARAKLIRTRKAIIASWMRTADALDAQGEVVLAADVRHFAGNLPPVLTDKERLAIDFLRHRGNRIGTTCPGGTQLRAGWGIHSIAGGCPPFMKVGD